MSQLFNCNCFNIYCFGPNGFTFNPLVLLQVAVKNIYIFFYFNEINVLYFSLIMFRISKGFYGATLYLRGSYNPFIN